MAGAVNKGMTVRRNRCVVTAVADYSMAQMQESRIWQRKMIVDTVTTKAGQRDE